MVVVVGGGGLLLLCLVALLSAGAARTAAARSSEPCVGEYNAKMRKGEMDTGTMQRFTRSIAR